MPSNQGQQRIFQTVCVLSDQKCVLIKKICVCDFKGCQNCFTASDPGPLKSLYSNL